MKGFRIGYENNQEESKFYVNYKNINYGQFLSKYFNRYLGNRPLEVELHTTKSAFSNKYGLLISNVFLFPHKDKIWTVDLELASKKKNIKLVNFEITPILKLKLNNEDYPLNFSFKYCNLEASRTQIFSKYDYSSILQSLFPFQRFVISTNHLNSTSVKLFRKYLSIIYKGKVSFSKLIGLEDSLKLHTGIKLLYDIPFSNFNLGLSNEFVMKKSFILKNKVSSLNNESGTGVNHLVSLINCNSKILTMNIHHDDNAINCGSDFYAQNLINLRIKDISWFKKKEILERIEPFLSLETIFSPSLNNYNFIDNFHSFLNMGIAVRINEVLSLDFALKTIALTDKCKIDMKSIGNFRILLNISTSL